MRKRMAELECNWQHRKIFILCWIYAHMYKKLFLGGFNDKWKKMIEIDELFLFYYFIPCLKNLQRKWILGDVLEGRFFGPLQLVITHKLYSSFKFKYILLQLMLLHFQKCKHPLSINWLMVIEMAFLLHAFVRGLTTLTYV
jgi:hypothetical protein